MYRVTETNVTVVAFVRSRRDFPLGQTGGNAAGARERRHHEENSKTPKQR